MPISLLAALLLLSPGAQAQNRLPGFGPQPMFPAISTGPAAAAAAAPAPAAVPVAVSSGPVTVPLPGNLGAPIDMAQGGPWVVGEVLFFSAGQLSSDYTLTSKVRAARGTLYTKSDIDSDVGSLMSTGKFAKVDPALFSIPSAPVPPEYATIAASTSEVRLAFNLTPKTVEISSTTRPRLPSPVSGLILTPTAYRGTARTNQPGLGLDFNAMYVIGRLYGTNNYANAPDHTNYLDRIGVWLLQADGKMQIQSEGKFRPAMAVGTQPTLMFRDSPQPQVNSNTSPTVTANAGKSSTRLLADAYFVASKKFGPVRTSAGIMYGNVGDAIVQFSEFLSPQALQILGGQPAGTEVIARTMPFVSALAIPHPNAPLGVEIIRFDGAQAHPLLIDFKIGYFLHLNFDLAYLKFDGGHDLLGLLQFRFNQFPR